MNNSVSSRYNQIQNFNFLTRWLHSFRYRHVEIEIQKMQKAYKDKKLNILDIGCADAKLYYLLNKKFNINYTGIELDEFFVKTAKKLYLKNNNFNIIQGKVEDNIEKFEDVDVIVSLETFEHIPEKNVVRIIEKISILNPKLFIISVPVEIGPAIVLKNFGSFLCRYQRHKEYTFMETIWSCFEQLDKIPRHGTGHKGFNWKWLAQTVRHNMRIKQIKKFPFNFIPASFSTSVFMVITRNN